MSKKMSILITAIALIALFLSIVSFTTSSVNTRLIEKLSESETQYVMYIGTNDKDTNEPVCTPEEAKSRVEDILVQHFGGYTIQEADGGWEDGGIRYREYSVVVYLSDTDLNSVHAAADDLIKEFNQSSVLIQANETRTAFYGGSN